MRPGHLGVIVKIFFWLLGKSEESEAVLNLRAAGSVNS
jgi:hypothetical protein